MSSMSYSAEYLSQSDEEREFEELTDAERDAILDDMYGRRRDTTGTAVFNTTTTDDQNETHRRRTDNNNDTNEGDDEDNDGDGDDENEDGDGDGHDFHRNDSNISSELLEDFYAAIEKIPPDESGDFWQAWLYHSYVFETESNVPLFLRCEDYDPEKAAIRACKYWEIRVEIFKDRAFQPMILQGAMKDVIPYMVHLPTLFRILPNDKNGRTVICWDKTNVKFKDYDDKIFLKMLWFVIHEALKERSTQENGIVYIGIDRDSTWDFPSHALIKISMRSLIHCLPIKISCTHFCISSLVATCVLPILKSFCSRDFRLRIQIHSSITTPTIVKELETFGLCRDNLPKSIGGQYNEKPTWINECEHMLNEQQCHSKRQRRASRDDQ